MNTRLQASTTTYDRQDQDQMRRKLMQLLRAIDYRIRTLETA